MNVGRGQGTSSWCWDRVGTLVLLVAVVCLSGTGVAHAATSGGIAQATTGATVKIVSGGVYDRPSVAISPTGTAYVAWYTNAATGNAVHYCVLPFKATACQSTGELIVGDGTTNIDAVQVLADSEVPTVSILADASGFPDTITEWQSTDGGATWPAVDNGLPVASAGFGDDFPVGGVILPGLSNTQLGFGWQTVGGAPTFDAFPTSSPPACSPSSMCPFATLAPSSEPDQVSNTDGSIAASSDPDLGVLAVYSTQETTGALGCRGDGEGLGFVYGHGLPSPTNSYSISPGQPGSAWQAPVARAECNLDAPFSTAAGGGLSSLGIIATDADDTETFYQPFHPATRSFGPKVEIVDHHESYPSLTGVANGSSLLVATFDDSSTDAIEMAASPDGGRTWNPPVPLDTTEGDTEPDSSINDRGDGVVAWLNDDGLFAKSFAGQPPYPTASAGSTAAASGSTMAITVHCSAACTITISITVPTVNPGDDAQVIRGARTRRVILATGTTRLGDAGTRRVTLHLTRSGRTLLKHHHRLNAKLMLSLRAGGRTITHTGSLHITYHP